MSAAPILPISDIVDVVVTVSPQIPTTPTFNVGLIVGNSTVIPASQRTATYTTLNQMLNAGFSSSSAEYLAAELYFGQNQPPQSLIVGRQDATSINTIAVDAEGTGYQVGDVLTVVQGGASGGTVTVTTVSGGEVTGVSITTPGTGYAVATGLATTGGHGTGCTLSISVIGDTALYALQQCRLTNQVWYACVVVTAVTVDHEAIAAYVQAVQPPTVYFYTTADAAALAGTSGNVFSYMASNEYNRVFGIYSTTQGGNAPNNVYAAAACMGVAMGLNTGLAGSYFTMFGKQLVGVTTEPLNQTQVNTIQGNNGNLYLNIGGPGAYNLLTKGVDGSGEFFDIVLGVDILTANIQYNCMDLFVTLAAIPMTDAGEQQLIHAVNQAAQNSSNIGFIATGVWEGITIINLTDGQSLPGGYLAQAYPYATQSASARAARQAMPIYLAIICAQAAQSLLVGVQVQS